MKNICVVYGMLLVGACTVFGSPRFLQNSDQSVDSWAHDTMQRLSLRQKIGQLFTFTPGVEDVLVLGQAMKIASSSPEEISSLVREYGVGGVIFLGHSTIVKQMDLINCWQGMSDVPLLVCEDCEWGLAMRLNDGIKYPRNLTLGAIQDEKLIYKLGYEIGRQCRAVGVGMNLAPVVDVNNNPLNPVIRDRSFGEEPARVARLGILINRGMQDAGILTCVKHFPGHGDTASDSHFSLPEIEKSREELEKTELLPFKSLIAEGADAVMAAHLAVPALDEEHISTFSYGILTELLRQEMGFEGLVVTDALCMGALEGFLSGDVELKAFIAGNDLFLCSKDIPLAIRSLENAVEQGIITEKEIDSRVLRILEAKQYLGLHKNRYVNAFEASTTVDTFDARALKKELYQEAVTIVKNKDQVIPLHPNDSIAIIQVGKTRERVLGKLLGMRCTGFSYALPSGITEKAVKNFLEQKQVTLCGVSKIVICITEMVNSASKGYGITPGIRYLVDEITALEVPIILILCGSPYALGFFGNQNGLIVAYEDDKDAIEATANVLTGDFRAVGKLPVSIGGKFPVGAGL